MFSLILIFLFLTLYMGGCSAATCSSTIKQGPFEFEKPILSMSIPSRHKITFRRAEVTRDVEIAVMFRSYWKSYCYMGGNIDPNTGCYRGITQDLPSFQEADEWIKNNKCKIGNDCTDCWGSDSVACLDPTNNRSRWVEGKELNKLENNNHFLFHTCNLSWRCGIHKTKFPTFAKWERGSIRAYTTFANGTEFDVDEQSFWEFGDIVMKRTQKYQSKVSYLEIQCFVNNDNEVACYDKEKGIFFELTDNWYCFKQICYIVDHSDRNYNFTEKKHMHDVNWNAASIEDVKGLVAVGHMLSEEIAYNMGILSEEVIELRKILINVILSVAKIDDKLIGNVMGRSARSQFLGEETFLLSPCSEPQVLDSNCVNDLIFKNGRWLKLTDPTQCLTLNSSQKISLFTHTELWFPTIKDQDLIGTAGNFEGWSYYANERDNLDNAMRWTSNGQSTTSLSDLYNLPKGLFNGILSGFAFSHMILYAAVGLMGLIIYKKMFSSGQDINIKFGGFGGNDWQNQKQMGSPTPSMKRSSMHMENEISKRDIYSRRGSLLNQLQQLQNNQMDEIELEVMDTVDYDDEIANQGEERKTVRFRNAAYLTSPKMGRRKKRTQRRRPMKTEKETGFYT